MIKGVHTVRVVRAGKPIRWYVYAYRGGPQITVIESPARPKLGPSELKRILDAQAEQTAPRDTGLLAELIRLWRGNVLEAASPEWQAFAPSTRDLWGNELNRIDDEWGDLPLKVWDDHRMVQHVIKWRDSRRQTPRAADVGVQVLRALLDFGKLRAMVKINVATSVPSIYRGGDRAEIVWTEENVLEFAWAAMALNRYPVVDGLDLACLTGLRRADLVAVTFGEVTEHAIVRTAIKKSKGRRRRAVVPLIPESRALIEELRTRPRQMGADTLLVNGLGRPWSPAAFTQAFNQVRDFAAGGVGIVQTGDARLGERDRKKHLHDCRGTFVTRLCRTDLTNEEIARIVAWSPENVERIRRTYVDDAAVVVALSERINRAL